MHIVHVAVMPRSERNVLHDAACSKGIVAVSLLLGDRDEFIMQQQQGQRKQQGQGVPPSFDKKLNLSPNHPNSPE
jgi:hypothetical protein